MPEKMAKQLFDFQCKCGVLNEEERRLYEYAYNLLICRAIVYLMIAVSGIWLGNLKEIIVFLLAFSPLRQYTGGMHLEKAERCIAASGILVCIAGQYLRYFPVFNKAAFLMWMAAIGIILVMAPIGCRNKKLDLIEYRVYRKRSRVLLGIECVFIVSAIIVGCTWISKGIVLAQAVLSVSLVLGWIKENFLL